MMTVHAYLIFTTAATVALFVSGLGMIGADMKRLSAVARTVPGKAPRHHLKAA